MSKQKSNTSQWLPDKANYLTTAVYWRRMLGVRWAPNGVISIQRRYDTELQRVPTEFNGVVNPPRQHGEYHGKHDAE